MSALPEDFEAIANIETLSIAVTKLELHARAMSYTNVAHLSLDEQLHLGMLLAVNEAKLMKARNALKRAQEEFAQ